MILPVFILSFVEAPIFWWLQVLLARHATVEAIGCMTIMKQIRNFSVLIPNYFVSTYLAFATELNIKKKYDLYFERFDKYSLLFLGVGCALVLIFSVSVNLFLDCMVMVIQNIGIVWFCLIFVFRLY